MSEVTQFPKETAHSERVGAATGIPLALFCGSSSTPEDKQLDITEVQKQVEKERDYSIYAEELFHDGKALEFISKSCSRYHEGDKLIIKALILSFVSTKIINSKGLHITINGSEGEGKSDAAFVVMNHLPRENVIKGHFSDKSLFYMPLKPRTVIVMDDQTLSPDFEDTLKASTSDWTVPFPYHTVGQNREPVELSIPERCPRWFIRVTSEFDEQTADRMLIMKVDESLEQKNSVKSIIDRHVMDPSLSDKDSEKVIISRMIFDKIPDCKVSIPFADKISFDLLDISKRSYRIFLSIIMAFAIMSFPKREVVNEETKKADDGREVKIQTIAANEEDFENALELFSESQCNKKLNFTSLQLSFLDFLDMKYESDVDPGFYYKDLAVAFGEYRGKTCAMNTFSQIVHGRKERNTPSLEDIPGITLIQGINTRQKMILWNREEYRKWKAGGMNSMFKLVKN